MRLIISFLYIYIYVSLDEASELGTKAMHFDKGRYDLNLP